ncbi:MULTISPECIES: DASH family cryptochrome [unclassified Robiginitalea]|uniref:DASH family cryptochrome n=1 Tax=Robiginitalea TaxID=252306 RepID=UPI00234A3975|nr:MULTISPECIES: DASH family cryptochrome [unclassified Robiginitalea]MDC6354658.1 DASH family cryptochrome [Robiginitalea sp. PM2]MDC6374660.1 DASH family cryptochrome [Robiginitalea sp. SP8]
MNTALYWFRNDLRVADNPGLLAACRSQRVLTAYCFDPEEFREGDYGIPRMGSYRTAFLRESVQALQEQLQGLNISLHIHFGSPGDILPGLIRKYGVTELHLQREWTRDECLALEGVRKRLPSGVAVHEYYQQFLFHPDDVPYNTFDDIPDVFTGFRKKCEKRVTVREPENAPARRETLYAPAENSDLPGWEAFGMEPPRADSRTAFPFRGGEVAAWDRLQEYFWETRFLSTYKRTRNGLVGTRYSTKFSPWLANGSLSARQIYRQVQRYEREVEKNRDTYWLIFELIWRDYFKYVSLKQGPKLFAPGGIREVERNWGNSAEAFARWTRGETDSEFINANMQELLRTGWMSNRGRQNTASYWSQNLGQDWRLGAAWFQYLLLDYDVHSNWGNWMYNSAVGNDPRNRKFNLELQASRYDASGKFRRLWLQASLFDASPPAPGDLPTPAGLQAPPAEGLPIPSKSKNHP